jgi:uncharacterized protein (TIGR00156 family)
MKIPYVLAVLSFAAAPLPALAQYQGPGAPAPAAGATAAGEVTTGMTTVQAIKADPSDDAKVVLEGRLIRQISAERYLFADDSGEIEVEIDEDDFPRQPVTETTLLRLEGEVDTHRSRDTDIDVERVQLVN